MPAAAKHAILEKTNGKGAAATADYVYLLRCENASLYCGVTSDPARRFLQHSGRLAGGARSARMLHPAAFAAVWRATDRCAALSAEARIKHLSHAQKERLIADPAAAGTDFPSLRRMALTNDGKGILTMLFLCYPKCSTCKKAQAWLDQNGFVYTVRDIKTDRPSEDELRAWHKASGLPLKRFFNTSGLQYKALGLSQKLSGMTEDEQFALLASDGMLVRRPILIEGGAVRVGFREAEWETLKPAAG